MRIVKILGIIAVFMLIAACSGKETTDITPKPAASCSDNIQNQGETEIDCGGPCPACPSCTDGVKNQDETGVDCGGSCKACESCNDGFKNQDEEGIDCGGVCDACQAPVPTPTEAKYEISAADKQALNEKLTPLTDALFAKSTVLDMQVGDSHVFALGFTNLERYDTEFKVNVSFIRARDLKDNPIAVDDANFDESYMLQWLGKNDFSKVYGVDEGAQAIVPIIVVVGPNYAPSKQTKSGVYYFAAKITYKNAYDVWDEYRSRDFSVGIS